MEATALPAYVQDLRYQLCDISLVLIYKWDIHNYLFGLLVDPLCKPILDRLLLILSLVDVTCVNLKPNTLILTV
jgi:hypothetical protein